MTLELKHIAPYLPYELYFMRYEKKCLDKTVTPVVWSKDLHPFKTQLNAVTLNGFDYEKSKPILRPLSDLTKEIEVNGTKYESVKHYFEEIYYTQTLHKQVNSIIQDERWVNHCEYILVKFLFEHHFDVFGLIEHGLAINVNAIQS